MRSSHLKGKVVVITGASSGIGRAAAVRFARAGCTVVVAARREAELEVTARLCRDAGGDALVVPTDVTREADVEGLVRTALATLGGIDIWINNAGVTLFALLSEAPFAEHARVFETNVFGPMLAARLVIPYFEQRGRGVLINVGSVLSKVGQPYVPSYVVSKFALRGLTEALRAEVAELPDVHVCSFLPYAVDTPHFEEGANVRGTRARPMPPTQSPENVARALVDLAARPRREVLVPRAAALGLLLHGLFPRTMERLLLRALARWHFDRRPERENAGNLRAPPRHAGRVHGRRGAQLSTLAFGAWVSKELVKMAASSFLRRIAPRRRALMTPARAQWRARGRSLPSSS